MRMPNLIQKHLSPVRIKKNKETLHTWCEQAHEKPEGLELKTGSHQRNGSLAVAGLKDS